MSSDESLAMWKRVAAGERGPDVDEWLRGVASAMVADVFEAKFDHAGRRAEAALIAVGMRGRLNQHAELDALATADFTQGSSIRQVAEVAPLLFPVIGTDEQVRRRVEHARRKAK